MDKTIHDMKAAMRKTIFEKKNGFDEAYQFHSNSQIQTNLFSIDAFIHAARVFCFVNFCGEVDTRPIIMKCLQMNKRVCVPRCMELGVMNAYEILGMDDLEIGMYGILEPNKDCRYVDITDIDFAVLPCITCDIHGNRLGYGGGFYDRYLANKKFSTAVLCWHEILLDSVPIEKHDIPADYVVTDKAIYYTT